MYGIGFRFGDFTRFRVLNYVCGNVSDLKWMWFWFVYLIN